MNGIVNVVKDNKDFYPTPEKLISKLIAGIRWSEVSNVLEPSAGKGDIAKYIVDANKREYHGVNVDCVEINPEIRQVLKWNVSLDSLSADKAKAEQLEKKCYRDMTESEHSYLEAYHRRFEKQKRYNDHIRIVGDDFLRYDSYIRYQYIIMNPPFSEGDKHLLKALEMQKDGGHIRCLLNAETLKNPYSTSRQTLLKKLNDYGAEIEFIENGFTDSERKTDVEVALIKVDIPYKRIDDSDDDELFKRMQKAVETESAGRNNDISENEIEVYDFIQKIVNMYKVEVRYGLQIFDLVDSSKRYLKKSFSDNYGSFLELNQTRETFVKSVRHKYWKSLMDNKEITGKMTSDMEKKYTNKLNSMTDYEFNEFNIKELVIEINADIFQNVVKEIDDLYDKLTVEHSWFAESSNNVHYYNGWCTNKAHKIGKKVILPFNGFEYGYFKGDTFAERKCYNYLQDIELVFNYLTGDMSDDVNLWEVIQQAGKDGVYKNIQCKYFKVTFYKKGTCHIVFTNMDVIDRYNALIGKKRNWLPPCYGKTEYKDLSESEKNIIDSFYDNENPEKQYKKVMMNPIYYLREISSGNLMSIGMN